MVVQNKDDFSIMLLLLSECIFVCFHTKKDAVLHLSVVHLGKDRLVTNCGVEINIHQSFHYSARRKNSTGTLC